MSVKTLDYMEYSTDALARAAYSGGWPAFFDESASSHILIPFGNAQISTAQSHSGGASGLFDGSGDYLKVSPSADFDFSTGNFSITAYVYMAAPTTGDRFIYSGAANEELFFGFSGANIGLGRAGVAWDATAAHGISANTWAKVNVTRTGTDVKFYVDDVQVGSTATLSTDYFVDSTLYIGSQGTNYYYTGYLDDLEVVKGTTTVLKCDFDKLYITPYFESTIKEQGSYSLKAIATTEAASKELIRNIAGSTSWSFNLTGNGNTTAKFNRREIIPAADISASGTAIRLKLKGHNTTSSIVSAVSIGERSGSTASFTDTPTRVTFNNGETAVVVPAGGYAYSDWITFALDETKDYLVALARITEVTQYEAEVSSGGGEYSHIASTDETMQTDGSAYSYDALKQTIAAIEVDSGLPDLSGEDSAVFRIRASRTGSNIKVGIKDAGGTVTDVTPNISSADTWQDGTIDLSGVADANKNSISSIIVTISNADVENTFYLDNFYSGSADPPTTGTGNMFLVF